MGISSVTGAARAAGGYSRRDDRASQEARHFAVGIDPGPSWQVDAYDGVRNRLAGSVVRSDLQRDRLARPNREARGLGDQLRHRRGRRLRRALGSRASDRMDRRDDQQHDRTGRTCYLHGIRSSLQG